jgi:uncharacterized membrane protein YgdD (TMEM256/DUF423 family)
MTQEQNISPSIASGVRQWLIIGALLCMCSVLIGAFAAHGLKTILSAYALDIVQTGATYQMYHGGAIILSALLCAIDNRYYRAIKKANIAFFLGCIFFSGSLYILALAGIKAVAFLTPIGGVCFIAGWLLFVWSLVKAPHHSVNSNTK